MEAWELLGLLLAAGASAFGVVYAGPSTATLSLTIRAIEFHPTPEAALGLSSLALTAFASFAAIIIGQLKPAGNNIGASIIVWTDFVVLLIGDALFYLGNLDPAVLLLVGLSSAVLIVIGLGVIVRRPLKAGSLTG
jgi:hypothetical protein